MLFLCALLVGCGGSGSHQSSTAAPGPSATTSTAGGATVTSSRPGSLPPKTPGDAGYLTGEVRRAEFELLVAGIARARTSSPAVKSFIAQVMRDRVAMRKDDTAAARKVGLHLGGVGLGAAETGALRVLVPLTGARFDSAYVTREIAGVAGDVATASAAARTAQSAKVRALAASHLATYRAELRSLHAISP